MDYKLRCEVLERENAILVEKIKIFEDLFVNKEWQADPVLNLTQTEEKLCQVLVKRKNASKNQIMQFIYQQKDEPDIKMIDVLVCKIRSKLKPFDIKIETEWGKGYYLKEEDCQKLKEFDYAKQFMEKI